MEILLMMGAAFFVFLLFFLVLAMKNRKSEGPVSIHTCQNCGCGERDNDHLARFRRQEGKPGGCLNRTADNLLEMEHGGKRS